MSVFISVLTESVFLAWSRSSFRPLFFVSLPFFAVDLDDRFLLLCSLSLLFLSAFVSPLFLSHPFLSAFLSLPCLPAVDLDDDDEEEDLEEDDMGRVNMSIRTGAIEEKVSAVHALAAITQTGAAFTPYVTKALEALESLRLAWQLKLCVLYMYALYAYMWGAVLLLM